MKRLYRIFFFLAFPLSNYSVWFSMQADFSASSYLYIYLFKIPSHPQHSDTLLSSHTVPLCPTTVLCLFKVAIHFHFYHFISSLNDNINECITFWKRDEGSKERWIYTPPLLLLSHPLSQHIRCMPCLVEPSIWKWSLSRWERATQAVQMTYE